MVRRGIDPNEEVRMGIVRGRRSTVALVEDDLELELREAEQGLLEALKRQR